MVTLQKDHHGIQSLIRSADEELEDVDRIDLRYFIKETCGIGGPDIDEHIDVVDDIVRSSASPVNCGRSRGEVKLLSVKLERDHR